MPTFRVNLVNTVSATVEVEADSIEDALDAVYDSDKFPGSVTIGAFGPAAVDESQWEPTSVTDAAGRTVWTEAD